MPAAHQDEAEIRPSRAVDGHQQVLQPFVGEGGAREHEHPIVRQTEAPPAGLGIVAVPWLNGVHVAGFPLGFWFAQQGSIVIFVVLIFVYAVWMDRIEQRMRQDPGAE